MTATLTRARIEDALARANAAPEGPWESHARDEAAATVEIPDGPNDTMQLAWYEGDGIVVMDKMSANFTAEARSDVPDMAEALIRVLDLHPREVIAVHEGYGEEAWCPCCREHYPCLTVRAIAGEQPGGDEA